MGRAVGVARVRGMRVVMRVLLLVGQVMLQTAPGRLTATGTSAPSGAKAWTHSCCLTAVVTSHRCTGLVFGRTGTMWGREKGKQVGKAKRLV